MIAAAWTWGERRPISQGLTFGPWYALLVALGINHQVSRNHRLRNWLHTIVLIVGMAVLMGLLAWSLWGMIGVIWALIGVALLLAFAPNIPNDLMLRMYGAVPLTPAAAGQVHEIVDALTARAGLPARPRLYMIPSPILNAFATGEQESASIAVTYGMLKTLSLRELAGVLAHEISHVRNNDLRIMGLADLMSRVTQIMSFVALFLVLVNFPLMAVGAKPVPWLTIILLYLAPTAMSLLQLALSRAREFDADLEGARLSGDPEGLASALLKLERRQGRFWEDMFLGGRRIPDPSLLRSHPRTEERVARLQALAVDRPPVTTKAASVPVTRVRQVSPAPRFRWNGTWY